MGIAYELASSKMAYVLSGDLLLLMFCRILLPVIREMLSWNNTNRY